MTASLPPICQDKIYLDELKRLVSFAAGLPNTPMITKAKIEAMAILNLRYERVMLDRDLRVHPYILTSALVQDAQHFLEQWRVASVYESSIASATHRTSTVMEDGHRALFQALWTRFSVDEYQDRIERYVYRLTINGLADGVLTGAKCIDFGCGHGNFAHALLRVGAASICGIDFGDASIEYAKRASETLGVSAVTAEFRVASVYSAPYPDAHFDLAIQNGVFHHLDDEDAAYREVYRVLKPGGLFWVYTDGSGAISHDLWDASLEILRDIPQATILRVLDGLNLETGKRYHLGDGLNAVYRHTTWDELTARLRSFGFDEFRRLTGGFPTDFDHDVIATDPYGREKFGSGDLRLLARKRGNHGKVRAAVCRTL